MVFVFINQHFYMGNAQLLVSEGIVLNPILKFNNHVTLGKSRTMDNNPI